MIRLSIIIPFYNVEQYIAQCLDSVYAQDIPEEEYEVICVLQIILLRLWKNIQSNMLI